MSRRAAGRVVAAVLTVAAFGVLHAPWSAAEGGSKLEKAAWWSKSQPDGAPLATPTPPNVPDGGLQITGNPEGASSVAALRFSIPKGEGTPKLKLMVTPQTGDINGASAIIAACRTGSGWGPPAQEPGAFDQAPTADCSATAKGERAADGTFYTFNLSQLMITEADGTSFVDIIIAPGTDPSLPAGANGSSFQLTFDKPSNTSLSTTSSESAASSDFSASEALANAGVQVDPSSGLVNPSTLGSNPISSAAPPAFTPSLPAEQQQVTATAPAVQSATARNLAPAPAKPEGKPALAFFILLAAGAAAWWAQRQPLPEMHRLGAMGANKPAAAAVERAAVTPQLGGLGRFARPRTGAAPSL